MKLRMCSAMKLLKLSKKKKIICFGAGGHLHYVFDTYQKLGIEKNIAYVVDNDASKIGKKVIINGRRIEVCSPIKLRDEDYKKHIIVITTLKTEDIFIQIQDICGANKPDCYKAPTRKYSGTKIIETVSKILPLKNVIVIKGEGETCDNTLALYNYIVDRNFFKKYTLVHLCEHPDRYIDTRKEKNIYTRAYMNASSIKELIRYYYYVGRAKYIIYENVHIKKQREKQILVYLSHGWPLKATKGIINLPKEVDYCLCTSTRSVPIFAEQFSVDEDKLIISGYPRTDVFYKEDDRSAIEDYLQISKFRKVILWLPTFRQKKESSRVDSVKEFELGIPILSSEEEFRRFIAYIEEKNILIILKPHMLQDLSYIKVTQSSNFRILKQDDLDSISVNVYDLMKYTDALISDYSSVTLDYLLRDKPIGYTVDDMKEYKLGFSVPDPLEYMPGNIIRCVDDLFEFMEDVWQGRDRYIEQRQRVNKEVNDYRDGNNCQRVCGLLGIEK